MSSYDEWKLAYYKFRQMIAHQANGGATDEEWQRTLNAALAGDDDWEDVDWENLSSLQQNELASVVNGLAPWYQELNDGLKGSPDQVQDWLIRDLIPFFEENGRQLMPSNTAPGRAKAGRPISTDEHQMGLMPPVPEMGQRNLDRLGGKQFSPREELVRRRDDILSRLESSGEPDVGLLNYPKTILDTLRQTPNTKEELLEIDQELRAIDGLDSASSEGGTRDEAQEHGGQRGSKPKGQHGTPHNRQGVDPGDEMVPIKSWDEMSEEEQAMETKLLGDTLGLAQQGIETRNELPAGETAAGYFQKQQVFTKWQQWEKSGKIFDVRQRLFDAGYYRGTSKDGPAWNFDFSEGVNDADIQALTNAMTDANLEDPTQGGKTLGLQKFLRGENKEIQESVSEKAQLRQDIKTRMYQYGLSENQSSVDSYVQKLMNGSIAYTDMDQAMLDRAKQLYPAWVKQLDSGMTMDAIADPYISRAESILEVPNMTWDDPLLSGALNTPGKDGTPSYMSLTEFDDKLRDDPRWEYTSDAHNYYGGLQNKIMETWGM